MTFSEILEITDWNERTGRRYLAEASAMMPSIEKRNHFAMGKREEADFEIDETCAILEAGGIGKGLIKHLRREFDRELEAKKRLTLLLEETTSLKETIKSLPPPVSSMLSVSQYVEKYHPQCPISSEPLWLNCLWRSSMAIARERGMVMAQTTKAVRSISVHESDVFPEEIIAAAIASYTSENWRAIELNKDDVKERIAAERRMRNEREEPEESPYWT